MKRLAPLLAAALLAAGTPEPAVAHALAPSYLELRAGDGGRVDVLWKTPLVVPRGVRLAPELPCPSSAPARRSATADAVLEESRITCAGGLVGRELAVNGMVSGGTETILHVALADGREIRSILRADAPRFRIPARESAARVFASYLWLGVEHLMTGLDHVLFVTGLVLLLGATRRLLVGVTAFTLGHSCTLALAVLGFVRVPQAAAEIAIAGSIVVLARELALSGSGPPGALTRLPAILPFAFGLLHGLGFAGALRALGLPSSAIPLALFSFNVGIEVGQLGLIAAIVPFLLAGRRLPVAWPRSIAELPATAIGGLGVFWCIDRAVGWLLP